MTSIRAKIIAVSLFAASATGVGLVSSPAIASPVSSTVSAHHACTLTSTHKCIRGGEFCPKAKYNKSGYDAKGRRYVCKGSRTHPHWEKP